MKKTWLALGVCSLSVALAAETPRCSIAAHQAAPAIHHKYSQKTLDVWAAWRKKHPDWKQVMDKFDFACPVVATRDAEVTDFIPKKIPPELVLPPTEIDAYLEPEPVPVNLPVEAISAAPVAPLSAPSVPESPTIELTLFGFALMVLAEALTWQRS